MPSPVEAFSSMAFVDPNRGFAVTFDASLEASTDGGRTWQLRSRFVPPGASMQRPKVVFTTAEVGFVFEGSGTGGPLFVTGDGGRTWAEKDLSALSVVPIGNDVWVLGFPCSSGAADCPFKVLVSQDGGRSWRETRTLTGLVAPRALARVSHTEAYVLASTHPPKPGADVLAHTRDGGLSWRYERPPCDDADQRVAALPHSQLWFVCGGQPATIMQAHWVYRSSDAGRTWTLVGASRGNGATPAVGEVPGDGSLGDALQGLAVVSDTHAWMALDRTGLFATVDGGRTWRQAFPFGPDSPFGGFVTFIDQQHGWTAARGAVWRTTDGANWAPLS